MAKEGKHDSAGLVNILDVVALCRHAAHHCSMLMCSMPACCNDVQHAMQHAKLIHLGARVVGARLHVIMASYSTVAETTC